MGCRQVLWGSVVAGVVKECCREVLWRIIGEECCREVLKRIVEEKCWRRVL